MTARVLSFQPRIVRCVQAAYDAERSAYDTLVNKRDDLLLWLESADITPDEAITIDVLLFEINRELSEAYSFDEDPA